jgi:hypothetical protein
MLDDISRRRLVLTRRIFDQGVDHCADPVLPFRGILAVIAFDWANESVALAAISALDERQRADHTFNAILDRCETLLREKGTSGLTGLARVKHVHQIRNDCQHRGRHPNPSEVQDCRTYTRDFINEVTTATWGIEIDSVRLSDLVQDNGIRAYLSRAEQAHDAGDFNEAACLAAASLRLALNRVEGAIIGTLPMGFKGWVPVDSSGPFGPGDARSAAKALRRMRTAVLLGALHLDLDGFARFASLTPAVLIMADGSAQFQVMRDVVLSQLDVEWILAFVASAVISIEDRVGDVGKPFGREPWEEW